MTDSEDAGASNDWDPERYDGDHAFVHEYGADLLDLLDPRPGERVLDVGCGTGHLTAEIAARGAEVVGIDDSAAMIESARETYPEASFVHADATTFDPEEPFEAVFSNAALHWIDDQVAVADRVRAALAPDGRFVAELGGHGNVATVVDALLAACRDRGLDVAHPWYFPTVGEYVSLLESRGLEVTLARSFDRPTALDGGADGLADWIETFGDPLLEDADDAQRTAIRRDVEEALRPALYDAATTTWTVDYRRLRVVVVPEA